jgi:hypothetical protein
VSPVPTVSGKLWEVCLALSVPLKLAVICTGALGDGVAATTPVGADTAVAEPALGKINAE